MKRRHKRTIFLIIVALLVPLLIETGARIVYTLRLNDSSYLLYPKKGLVAINTVILRAVENSFYDSLKLPEGPHEFIVNGKLLHVVDINKSGYRGRDFQNSKKAKWRIASMGGSSTFSAECPVGQSYPEILEQLLNEKYGAGTAEVVNRGMVGMPTSGIVELLERDVVRNKPDMVTVCSAYNAIDDPLILDLRPGSIYFYRRLLWGKSLFYTAMLNSRLCRKIKGADYSDVIKQKYEKSLIQIIDIAKKNSFKLLFIGQPMARMSKIKPEMLDGRLEKNEYKLLIDEFANRAKIQSQLSDLMIDTAKREDVFFVDPRPAFNMAENPAEYFWFALHLTAKGSVLMAEEIERRVSEKYGGFGRLIDR